VEVITAEIKIVGAASDEEMVEEIESVAKVFVYEQRMKSYTQPLKIHCPAPPSIKKPCPRPAAHSPLVHPRPAPGYVKGFC